jgi:hypothetical protein
MVDVGNLVKSMCRPMLLGIVLPRGIVALHEQSMERSSIYAHRGARMARFNVKDGMKINMKKYPLITDQADIERISKMVETWLNDSGGMWSDVKSAARGAVREYIANSEGKTFYKYRAEGYKVGEDE